MRRAAASIAGALSATDFGCCLFLIAIPLVMSAVNASWMYTSIGWLDPWYNVAYFLHYSDPTFLNSYYKIARLSWIIPGFITYKSFQPIVANYILHMGCLLISVVFFFFTVSRLFGRAIAFTTSACFAVFAPFHGSGGWDYQNTPAGAYYILAFYLLTSAVQSKDMRIRLFGAGAAYAAAGHATVAFINMAPILAAHFFVLWHRQFSRLPSRRTILRTVFWCLFGGIVVTVTLALINVAVGRDFIFFKVLLSIVISRVQDSQGQAQWWLPWSSNWYLQLPSVQYMAPIVAVLVGCTASIILATIRPRGNANAIAVSLQAEFVFSAAVWIIWQSLGQVALEPDYFAYPLYPIMFFALAGLAATWLPIGEGPSASIPFCLAIAIAGIFSLSIGPVGSDLFQLVGQHADWAIILSAFSFVALFAASMGQRVLIAVSGLCFFASNALGVAAIEYYESNRHGGAAAGKYEVYAYEDQCSDRAGAFSALIDANRFLMRFVANSQEMFVWWDKDETLSDKWRCTLQIPEFASSMTSFGLQYLASPWDGMPGSSELPRNSISVVSEVNKLAVVTANVTNVDRLIARFNQNGVALTVQGQTIIRTSLFAFNLYVLGLAPGIAPKPPERKLGPLLFPVALSELEAWNGGNAAATPDGLTLVTAVPQWTYSLSGLLFAERPIEGPVVVHLRLHVSLGAVGIVVSAAGETSDLTKEVVVNSSAQSQVVDIDIPDARAAGSLIFRNVSPRGESRAVIQAIEVYRPD